MECSRTDLNHKSLELPGTVVQPDSTRIAHDLIYTSQDHTSHVPPLFPPDAQDDMDYHCEAEEDDEGNVCRETWSVFIDAGFYGAERQRTISIWPKEDEVTIRSRHIDGLMVGIRREVKPMLELRVDDVRREA